MKAIDMTHIMKKYQGYFVALSYDRKKVSVKVILLKKHLMDKLEGSDEKRICR